MSKLRVYVRFELDKLKYHVRFDGDDTETISVFLDEDGAVELTTGLVKAGVDIKLPNDESYIAGELEATKLHLKDMRRLVIMENPGGVVE